MFEERKRVKRYKPYILKFWKRELGPTWVPFEREKIIEFSKIKPDQTVSISGYVKRLSNNVFALIPTLFSNQISLICYNRTERMPNENSYVFVYGRAEHTRMAPISQNSTFYKSDKIIQVIDWETTKPDITIPKIGFEYQDFKRDLTKRIEGLEPEITDFLTFTSLSTPSFFDNIGGINLTMYDSTTSGLPRLVVREMRRIIPPDIGKNHTVITSFGRYRLQYKFNHVSVNADKPLSKRASIFLAQRTRAHIKDYDEVSLSLHSSKDKPKTILDPPCNLSDIPTVIPEITTIDRSVKADPEFDSFKYMIIQQMKMPVISDYDSSLMEISNNLEKLREEYGLTSSLLTKRGFLNANYNAKPTSILRKSLAYARAKNIDVVDKDLVKWVTEKYFNWNFRYVYEIWEDLILQPKIPLSLRVEYRDIMRVLRKYQDTKTPCVSEQIIKAELKTNPIEIERRIQRMIDAALIYESTKGCYRITPET